MLRRRFITSLAAGLIVPKPARALYPYPSHDLITGGGAAINPLASSWAAAVATNGGTVTGARRTLVSNLITSLQSAGVWTLLDRLWLLCGEDSPSALTDLVAHSLMTVTNNMQFTANLGYIAQNAISHLNSSFNFSTASQQWTQNSGHLMIYTNLSVGDAVPSIGDAASNTNNIFNRFSGSVYGRINNGTQGGFAAASSLGFTLASRTAATTTTVYRNASSIGVDAGASSAPVNDTLIVCGAYNGVSIIGDSVNRLAAASIGGGLTGTQESNYYSALLTFLTAIGAN